MEDADFELLGPIRQIETIAVRGQIREIDNLRKLFGPARWRKLKGIGIIRFLNGEVCRVELHWYEAHGIGKRKMKVKDILAWL